MSAFNTDLYKDRTEIKAALQELKMTQGEFARRSGYVPSTFTGKLNATVAMDASEEKKILADIAALKGVEA